MSSDRTQPEAGGGNWLVYAFFAFVLSIPVGDLIFTETGTALPGRRFNPTALGLEWSDLGLGTAGSKLESYFEGRSLVYHLTGALYNEWIYQLTGRLPGLVVGKDNWLFLRSNVTEISPGERDDRLQENVLFIREVEKRMASRGIKLFVVLTPNRSRVSPERVYGERPAPPVREAFLPSFERLLTSEGIRVANLSQAFRQEISAGREVFFSEDHHWNHHGSEVAAIEVVSMLRRECNLDDAARARNFSLKEESVAGSPRRSLVTLLKFRKEGALESRFLREQRVVEFTPSWETLDRGDGTGAGIVFESSFGKYGFPQYLEMNLDAKLDSIVEPGNGSVFAISRFLAETPPEKESYRFAVWEIPEYHLLEGLANQGLGFPIVLPDPFRPEDQEPLFPALNIRVSGMSVKGRRYETRTPDTGMEVAFDQPVDRLRLRCRIQGNGKRGQILCEGSVDSGQLLLTKTENSVSYDFRLTEATEEVRFSLVFPEPGYRILDLTVEGGLSNP